MPSREGFNGFFDRHAVQGNGHNMNPGVRTAMDNAHEHEWHDKKGRSRKRLPSLKINRVVRDVIMRNRRGLYDNLWKAHKDLGPHHL